MELEQGHHHLALDDSPIDILYSFFREDYNDEGRGIRGRRHPKNDFNDLKIETLEFDGNLKLENYSN